MPEKDGERRNLQRNFRINLALYGGYSAADYLSTVGFLNKGIREGNNFLEFISPFLSPQYLAEHYGFEGLAAYKIASTAFVISLFLIGQKLSKDDVPLRSLRVVNLVSVFVVATNILAANYI